MLFDPLDPPTFTPKQVCAALEIPHGTLNSWAHVGILEGYDAEFTRKGKARHYSVRDLIRLSMIKYLMKLGMTLPYASSWVKRFSGTDLSTPDTWVRVSVLLDGSIRNSAIWEAQSERLRPPEPEEEVAFEMIFYPARIISNALSRIAPSKVRTESERIEADIAERLRRLDGNRDKHGRPRRAPRVGSFSAPKRAPISKG